MTSEAQKKAEAAKAAKAEEAVEDTKTDEGTAESVNDAFNNLIAAILRERSDNEERAALIGQLTALQLLVRDSE